MSAEPVLLCACCDREWSHRGSGRESYVCPSCGASLAEQVRAHQVRIERARRANPEPTYTVAEIRERVRDAAVAEGAVFLRYEWLYRVLARAFPDSSRSEENDHGS